MVVYIKWMDWRNLFGFLYIKYYVEFVGRYLEYLGCCLGDFF